MEEAKGSSCRDKKNMQNSAHTKLNQGPCGGRGSKDTHLYGCEAQPNVYLKLTQRADYLKKTDTNAMPANQKIR